jgi:hypothetical protein
MFYLYHYRVGCGGKADQDFIIQDLSQTLRLGRKEGGGGRGSSPEVNHEGHQRLLGFGSHVGRPILQSSEQGGEGRLEVSRGDLG